MAWVNEFHENGAANGVADSDKRISDFAVTGAATGSFQLQILHASDLEGGVDAIGRAPNFAALADLFEDDYANSITLSAGDNYIPGPFFSAAADPSVRSVLNAVYNDLYDTDVFTSLAPASGRIDISIMNVIGFDASALGNHEFDTGTNGVAEIIAASVDEGTVEWVGAQFPYLSANLDFSGSNLAGLTTGITDAGDFRLDPADIAGSAVTPKIAPATIIAENGEMIGVVGVTTPLLRELSSPGDVTLVGPTTNDMAALAAVLQPTIDALIAQGVDKIVLSSHLQQISLEQELAGLLTGVDVILAGGSDTLLADETDTLRAGDEAAGDYPFVTQGADGNTTLIVSVDGEYSYLGRLVVDFDENGNVLADSIDPAVSGVYATTDEIVAAAYGEAGQEPFAAGSKGELTQRLVDGVADVVAVKDGNVLGQTDVFLDGRREQVRTQETNLGNLTSEANLAAARAFDPEVAVSIKNGGGVRAPIGEIDGVTGELLPTADGQVSQLDVENALRFNNALSVVTVTAETLLDVVEHAFAAVAEGATPGQFPQIAGFAVSFNPSLPAGDRVQSLAIVDDTGVTRDVVVENGELVGDASRPIKVATLSFLADGGDGYPFVEVDAGGEVVQTNYTDRTDLGADTLDAGQATFADPGTEQDAFAEYLIDNFSDDAFGEAETGPQDDERIQNLSLRDDTVLDGGDGDSAALIDPVVRLYQTVFGRVPDEEGLDFWAEFYRTSGGEDSVGGDSPALRTIVEGFVRSDEFGENFPEADESGEVTAEFLDRLYEQTLGREPDAPGKAFYLGGDVSVAAAITAFAQSPEFIALTGEAVAVFKARIASGEQDFQGSLFDLDDDGLPDDEAGAGGDTLTFTLQAGVSEPAQASFFLHDAPAPLDEGDAPEPELDAGLVGLIADGASGFHSAGDLGAY